MRLIAGEMGEFHKVRKAPDENRPRHVPLCNVANLENIHENLTFTLATDEKSSRKIANSKYDLIGSDMNECLGELRAATLGKSSKIGKVLHEYILACPDSVLF